MTVVVQHLPLRGRRRARMMCCPKKEKEETTVEVESLAVHNMLAKHWPWYEKTMTGSIICNLLVEL